MAEQDGTSSDQSAVGGKLQINYIKSNLFRVIHADGAVGGLSPAAAIIINFYSERHPIPQVQVHRLSPEGRLSEEILEERVVRNGIVREVEAMVRLDLSAAKALATWLETRIKEAETAIGQRNSRREAKDK